MSGTLVPDTKGTAVPRRHRARLQRRPERHRVQVQQPPRHAHLRLRQLVLDLTPRHPHGVAFSLSSHLTVLLKTPKILREIRLGWEKRKPPEMPDFHPHKISWNIRSENSGWRGWGSPVGRAGRSVIDPLAKGSTLRCRSDLWRQDPRGASLDPGSRPGMTKTRTAAGCAGSRVTRP